MADAAKNMIFVFGSNIAGRHGKGAALLAKNKYGAVQGLGSGRMGNSYAITTKDGNLQTLPLWEITARFRDFLDYARSNPETKFALTPIGTGLAGISHDEIWDMVKQAKIPANVYLTASWIDGELEE